jgi:hypothetical protein
MGSQLVDDFKYWCIIDDVLSFPSKLGLFWPDVLHVLQKVQDNGIPMDSDRAQQVPPLRRALRMLEDWQQTERLGTVAPKAAAPGAALPSGWQSTTDPNTGQPYYWRTEDPAGTVTWQRPS